MAYSRLYTETRVQVNRKTHKPFAKNTFRLFFILSLLNMKIKLDRFTLFGVCSTLMKFSITLRPYPAGAGSTVHDELWVIEGRDLRDALDKFYRMPNLDPTWRVVDVRIELSEGR